MVYSIGGIMLKGSNPKYWQKNLSHCHFIHYRIQSGHGSTPGLHGENPDTHRLGHGKTKTTIGRFSLYFRKNTMRLTIR
jgi:hypothetical protein